MVGYRWARSLVPGIAALGTVAAIATSAQAARVPPWPPQDCAGGGPARVAVARAAGPPDPSSLNGEPWFRADPRLDAAGALDGQRLTVGRRGDAALGTLELPAESFAAGPFGGLVLVGQDDGASSALSTLDLAAGCRSTVDTTTDVIRRATIGPDGTTVYEARVARGTRADLGVWSRPLDGAEPARQVLSAPASDGQFGRTWSTEFAWSVEGDRLAVQSCGAAACRTTVLDPSDGSMTRVDDPSLGVMVGVADDWLVSHAACRGFPCPVIATDLASGRRRVLADDAGPAVLTAEAGSARVVIETAAGTDRRLRSLAPNGSAATDLGPIVDGLSLDPIAGGPAGGFRLPPGWVLLAPDGQLPLDPAAVDPTLRQALDGRTVRLDEVTR